MKYKILLIVIFAISTFSAKAQWTALSGPPGANVLDIEYSTFNSTVYAIVNDKIYSGGSTGSSWSPLVPATPSNLNVHDLLVDGSTLYGLYYSNLFKSTDGGANWVRANVDGQYVYGNNILKVAANTFAVYGYSGMFVSKDGGANWVQLSTDGINTAVANSSGDLFYADIKGIRKHVNPGVNPWSGANVTLVYDATTINTVWQYAYQYIGLGVDTGDRLYAGVYNDVIKSINGGTTWTSIKAGLPDAIFQTYWNHLISVSPTGTVYLNNWTAGNISFTADQGASWKVLTNYPSAAYSRSSTVNLAFVSGTQAFAGTTGDGIFLSSNINAFAGSAGSATWTFATNGLNAGAGTAMKIGGTVGSQRLTYANGGKLWSSTDLGVTWVYNTPAITGTVNNILKMPNGNFIAVNTSNCSQVFVSTNFGGAWTTVAVPGCVAAASLTSDASNVVYAGSGNAVFKSSTVGGTNTWTSITTTGMPAAFNINQLAVDATSTYLYAYLYNNDVSTNEIWQITLATGAGVKLPIPSSFQGNYFVSGFFVNSTGKLYVAQQQAIYYSGDSGSTWTTVSFSNNLVFPIAGGVCVSASGSLYITKDDGLNWSNTSLPSSDGFISSIDTDGTNYYAAANGLASMKYTGSPVPTSAPVYINFSWQPTSGPFGGYVNQIQVDNANNFYALSNGHIFKSSAPFATWTDLNWNNGDYSYGIYYDKTGNKLYSNEYGSLFSSADGGSTWTPISNNETVPIYYRTLMTKCPNGDLVVVAQNPSNNYRNGVYVSTNGGTTFGAFKYALGLKEYIPYPVQLEVSSTNVIYFPTYDSLGYSKLMKSGAGDHGATWTQVSLPAAEPYFNYVSTDNAGNVYITTGSNIYKSSDAGVTWNSIRGDFVQPNNSNIGKLYVQSPTLAYLAVRSFSGPKTSTIYFKSINGGTNWTQTGTSPNDETTLAISSTNATLVAGSIWYPPDGINVSTDAGATFNLKNNGVAGINLNQLELLSQSKIMAVGQNTYSSVNGGNAWVKDSQGQFAKIFQLSSGTFIGVNNSQIYSSANGGISWTTIGSTSFGISSLTSYDGTFYFAVASDATTVYYSSDLIAWTKIIISGLPSKFYINQVAADPNGLLYMVLSNQATSSSFPEIYQVQFGTASKINNIKSPYSVQYYQGKVYIFDGTGAIFSSSDGSTFARQSTPTGDKLIIAAKNYYFIPSYQGALWLSRDQGTTWQNVGVTNYPGDFLDVIVNEFDGYAYGILPNSAVRKSANIVIPNDLTAPVVTAFSPANSATGTTVGSISITFDEAVKPTSAKFLKILDVANPISPVATIDATTGIQNGKTFTYAILPTLAFNKTYFIAVDNDAFEDIFGNKFAGIVNNTTWRFTTRALPTITSLSPANNATGAPVVSPLTITFSEPFTTGTGNFNLYKTAQPTTPVATFSTSNGPVGFVRLSPSAAFPQEQVVVIFDATQGDQALLGASKVYFHAGVVTDTITGTGWQHVVGNYGQDDGIGLMTAVAGSPNKWQITLGPTLRQYFNVNANTPIYRLAMVFRNANGSAKAAPPATVPGAFVATNGDLFINLNQTACANAVLSGGNTVTFTLCAPLIHKTQYFVKFDPLDFVTADSAKVSYLINNTDWTFTTIDFPDTIPPLISFTPPTFTKGTSNKISVGITDAQIDSVLIRYRTIMSPSDFSTATMGPTGSPINNVSTWEIAVPDNWLDALGLEYYFIAKDVAKNTTVAPATAETYFDSYISLPGTASPTVSGLPSGGGAIDYRMFSIPYTLTDPKISTLFGLGTPDKTKIRILTFVSGTTTDNTTWQEYDKLQNITRGVGYWINSTKSSSFTITGATTPKDTKSSEFNMSIKSGWNQIGNPYPFEISWNAVKASTGNTNIGSVHIFNGSFSTGDKLAAGAAGFVFNGAGAANIRIPFTAATGGRVGEPADPFATEGWIMPITLEQGEVKNALGGVGMHPTANLSYDGLDDLPLPQLFNSIEMKFSHPEFFAKTFNRDIVPVQNDFVWEFTIDSSLPGLATMNWSNPVHTDKDIYLFDIALQKPINMLLLNQYTFNPKESARFRIYYGETVIKPDYLFLGKAYPNPTGGSTTIPFSLPDNNSTYKVKVEVYDMMGKKVATVVEGEFKPGFYNSEWNGSISNVPEGMYIYQMVVSDAARNELKTGKVVLKK